jgi:hypothetical protein
MPTIAGNLIYKTVGETVGGELFRLNFGGELGICVTLLSAGDKPAAVIGAIQSNEQDRPTHMSWSADAVCASYGTGWVLDPVWGSEGYQNNRELEEVAKVLWCDDRGAVLNFYPRLNDHTTGDHGGDIISGGLREPELKTSLPVRHWRIWASEADRNRPGAKPVVEYGAPKVPD